MGDQVPQGIAGMGAGRIGFVDLVPGIAMRIGLPLHPLQVLNQLLAAWTDYQPALTGLIAQARVHAIHSIAHRRVGGAHLEDRAITVAVAGKEVAHQLPVRPRGRGAACLTRRISIHIHSNRQAPRRSQGVVRSTKASQAASVCESASTISSITRTDRTGCSCGSRAPVNQWSPGG